MSSAVPRLAHPECEQPWIFAIKNSKIFFLFITAVLTTLTGCTGVSSVGSPQPAGNQIKVTISPSTATLTSGGSLQFSAAVTGTSQTGVNWSASAGKISASGMLQAPTVISASNVTVTATSEADKQKQASAVVVVTVPTTSPVVTTTALPSGTVGVAYSASISAEGGQPPYQWSHVSGVLPPGIALNAMSGVLIGTPTSVGTFSFVVGLRDTQGNSARQSFNLTVSQNTSFAECNAPTYGCARTDTAVIPLGALPSWGGLQGAGTIFLDPSFNSSYPPKYVRVTDAKTTADGYGSDYSSFSVGSGSGDDSHFNLDDTLFWVSNDGNWMYVFGLNPETMAVGPVWKPNLKLALLGSGAWSQMDRRYLYAVPLDGKIYKLDFTGLSIASPGTPNVSAFYDYVSDCGVDSSSYLIDDAGIGGRDTVFGAAYGGQDIGHQVAAYNSSSGTCYLYDTLIGSVRSYPGGRLVGSATTVDRYSIHNAKISPDGVWMIVVMGSSCPSGGCVLQHAWKIGTTEVDDCVSSCGGHFTTTANGMFFAYPKDGDDASPQSPGLFRTWATFSSSTTSSFSYLNDTSRNTPVFPVFDAHPSAKNDPLGTHNYPILTSTWAPDLLCVGGPNNGRQCGTQVNQADQRAFCGYPAGRCSEKRITTFAANEIVGWTQTGTPSPLLRFGHAFNSGSLDTEGFTGTYAIGAASSTGKFYMFTTDGEGTLGSNTGNINCSAAAGTCRTDVFILNLSSPSAN